MVFEGSFQSKPLCDSMKVWEKCWGAFLKQVILLQMIFSMVISVLLHVCGGSVRGRTCVVGLCSCWVCRSVFEKERKGRFYEITASRSAIHVIWKMVSYCVIAALLPMFRKLNWNSHFPERSVKLVRKPWYSAITLVKTALLTVSCFELLLAWCTSLSGL